MKIGKLVRRYVPDIFAYCEEHPEELTRLMSEDYSNRTFGIYFAFCLETHDIPLQAVKGKASRYWVKEHSGLRENGESHQRVAPALSH